MYTFEDYELICEEIKKVVPKDLDPYAPINLDGGYIVIPTFHTKDTRKGEEVSRDYLIDNSTIKRIMNKALKNGLSDIYHGQGHLIMKNSAGAWDDFIVVKDAKKIYLKTLLLQNRYNPTYHTKEGDFKLVIEKVANPFDFVIIVN